MRRIDPVTTKKVRLSSALRLRLTAHRRLLFDDCELGLEQCPEQMVGEESNIVRRVLEAVPRTRLTFDGPVS